MNEMILQSLKAPAEKLCKPFCRLGYATVIYKRISDFSATFVAQKLRP